MFDITIKTGNGADERVAFRGVGRDDWRLADMARAIETAFAPGGYAGPSPVKVIRCAGGNPACRGTLTLRAWASDQWIASLGAALEGASWDFRTRKGYGDFIERLLAL